MVTADNQYIVNNKKLSENSINDISNELKNLKSKINTEDLPSVVINADAMSNHQSVINVMEAARLSGLNRVTFATQVK